MTELLAMRPESFDAYLHAAVERYAGNNVQSGRWSQASARQRSHESYASILPKGLQTPGVHLFEIWDDKSACVVGSLLFAVVGAGEERAAFVYDVYIAPRFRRCGHGMRAFDALETFVRGLGLSRIALHVFAYNTGAQALYAKLGYAATGINMSKNVAARTC